MMFVVDCFNLALMVTGLYVVVCFVYGASILQVLKCGIFPHSELKFYNFAISYTPFRCLFILFTHAVTGHNNYCKLKSKIKN